MQGTLTVPGSLIRRSWRGPGNSPNRCHVRAVKKNGPGRGDKHLCTFTYYKPLTEKSCAFAEYLLPAPPPPCRPLAKLPCVFSSGHQHPPITVSGTPQVLRIPLMVPGSFSHPRIFPRIPHPIWFPGASPGLGQFLRPSLFWVTLRILRSGVLPNPPLTLSLSGVFLTDGLGLLVWRGDDRGEVSFPYSV